MKLSITSACDGKKKLRGKTNAACDTKKQVVEAGKDTYSSDIRTLRRAVLSELSAAAGKDANAMNAVEDALLLNLGDGTFVVAAEGLDGYDVLFPDGNVDTMMLRELVDFVRKSWTDGEVTVKEEEVEVEESTTVQATPVKASTQLNSDAKPVIEGYEDMITL